MGSHPQHWNIYLPIVISDVQVYNDSGSQKERTVVALTEATWAPGVWKSELSFCIGHSCPMTLSQLLPSCKPQSSHLKNGTN